MKKGLKKRILVTGGGGFIGSSLIALLQGRYKIICLGRGNDFDKLKKFANKNVTFARGDIGDKAVAARFVKAADSIVHLAGGGGDAACLADPAWALKTHVAGTYFLARQAAKRASKQFIFASSYLTYGPDSRNKTLVKETARLKPESFYANLKNFAEQIIADSGANYTILRFANIYGYSPARPLQPAGALNNFIRACLERKNIPVRGSGKQTVDYLHIRDAAQAIAAALKNSPSKSVYNIGSGNALTIQNLARTAQGVYRKLYGKNTPIKYSSRSERGIAGAARMSIEKARRELGWRPAISLEAGIAELMRKNK